MQLHPKKLADMTKLTNMCCPYRHEVIEWETEGRPTDVGGCEAHEQVVEGVVRMAGVLIRLY